MENVLQSIMSFKGIEKLTKSKETNPEHERILKDLFQATEELNSVMEKYNYTDDENMIESYIYQEKAIRARYSYLLRLAKENHVQYDGIYIKEG